MKKTLSPSPLAVFFLAAIFAVLGVVPSIAQDDAQRKSELGVRQRLIELKMLELENKLTVIAEKLREKEPKRAELLVAAYQQSKEKLISKKMAEASELLDQGKLPEAEKVVDEVIQNLEALVRLLTGNTEQTQSKKEEMKQLEKWKKSIEERLKEEKEQKAESEKVANPEDAVKKLEAQIAKLKALIGKQKDVIKATEDNANEGLNALDKVADKQFEVRKATEDLKNEISGDNVKKDSEMGTDTPKDPKDGEPKDGEPKDGEPKEGEPKD